jgi:DNA-3-methyladenine glycosylase II
VTQQEVRSPEEHLRGADPVLAVVMDEVAREAGGVGPTLPPDPARPLAPDIPADRYGVLVRAIVSQNISSFASRAIYHRLTERFGGRPPTPRQILEEDPDQLRTAAGLSRAKTASLRSLAEHIVSGKLDLDRLHELSDEDVVAQLSAVKGVGTWTADMVLIFHLYRPDVLPVGDLELRRTVEKVYRLPGLPTPADLERIAQPWRPYRSLACLNLWQRSEKTPRL